MKILILFFILYIQFCMSQYFGTVKKTASPYPKKVRSGIVQYNNAGKYIKPKVITTKKPSNKREYTVFAKPISAQENRAFQIVPDSPYFPVDEPKEPERRSRVKKVLPEYDFLIRHKRSAGDNDGEERNTGDSGRRNSNPQSGAKQIKSPVLKVANPQGTKKINAQIVKADGHTLKSVKKPRQGTGAKNRNGQSPGASQAGAKKQKLRNPRIQEQRNKRVKQAVLVPKKLKRSQKRPLKSNVVQRKLKTSRQSNKNVKRVAQGQRNNASVVKGLSKSKGLDSRRLISSRDALIEDYPYTISIQKDGFHWCSGALLNPRMIITTANCLWRSNSISRLHVRVGSRHTDRGGQVTKIQEVMKHPGWKLRKNPDNDVALALLDRKIKFSHEVHGVDLPNRAMLPPFDDAWVTSWGSERRDGIYDTRSVNLQVYHARLLDRAKCNNVTQRFAVTVSENFICLAQTGRRAPCTRDTGAPAVSDGVLWGMASWGIRKLCGTERFPAMFSYLASPSNMDFIINATHILMSEERVYPFLDRYPMKKHTKTSTTHLTLPYKR